jgi:hypothetical protein
LARISSEIDSASTTLKYLPLSLPATAKAVRVVTVATRPPIPPAALVQCGVPPVSHRHGGPPLWIQRLRDGDWIHRRQDVRVSSP